MKTHLFGKQIGYKKAKLVLLSAPWSAAASFGGGAERGPNLIKQNSSQMDFFSKDLKDVRSQGIFLKPAPAWLISLNQKTRKQALPIIKLEESAPGSFSKKLLNVINQACSKMRGWVFEETKNIHQSGKLFGLVGGDHSVTEGAVQYFKEYYKADFGLLHIDAHADLRRAYQGFKYSHASVMYNVISSPPRLHSLVQVGVRDYSKEEYLRIKKHGNIHTFYDSEIKKQLFEGKTWANIVKNIIKFLPNKIYISLDVDGLEPHLFPHTGTPVPGGLSFTQLFYLLQKIDESQKEIVAFDVVETASPARLSLARWDGLNGARILYRLCQSLLK